MSEVKILIVRPLGEMEEFGRPYGIYDGETLLGTHFCSEDGYALGDLTLHVNRTEYPEGFKVEFNPTPIGGKWGE